MQVCEWIYDAEVRPGLWRVFNAHEVKWFVCAADTAAGAGRPVSVLGPDMEPVAGLLIPRCRGGMLEDALLGLAPLGAEELVCLLRGTIEATGGTDGSIPISRASLALADDGSVCALPGIEVPGEESEARELGELLYAAAQGVTFTETAVPLKNRDNNLPTELVDLIDALLLDGETGDLPRGDLLEAVCRYRGAERLPFYPGEPGVPVNDPPTAGLRPVTAAVNNVPEQTGPKTGAEEKAEQGNGDTAIAALRGDTERARKNRGSQAPRRGARKPEKTAKRSGPKRKEPTAAAPGGKIRRGVRAGVIGAAALATVAAGIALIIGGAQPDQTEPTAAVDQGKHGEEPRSPKAEDEPSVPAEQSGELEDTSDAAPDSSGPCEGFKDLTQARAAAFAGGKPADLAGLTVPGSNAAKADAESEDKPAQPMNVTMNVTECEVEDSTAETATVRAVVSAEVGETPVPEARIRVSLEKHEGKWKVSRTEEIHEN